MAIHAGGHDVGRGREIFAEPREHEQLVAQLFDAPAQHLRGLTSGLAPREAALLHLEDVLDLVEREAGEAHVGHEHQPVELTPQEEAVPAVGAPRRAEDAFFFVEANRSQRVVGAPGHFPGRQQGAVVSGRDGQVVFSRVLHRLESEVRRLGSGINPREPGLVRGRTVVVLRHPGTGLRASARSHRSTGGSRVKA